MQYGTYKLENGKMKKKVTGELHCTVFDVSTPLNGKILINARVNENGSVDSNQPVKLSVVDYVNGEISFERLSAVEVWPELFTGQQFGFIGDSSGLSKLYEFVNSHNIRLSRFFDKGIVYYWDRTNDSVLISSPETFLVRYQRDFLKDLGPAA
jgi:hypothetical protein